MTSFYGGGASGILGNNADSFVKIEIDKVANGNIIVSKTQPENQETGDLWFVIEGDD